MQGGNYLNYPVIQLGNYSIVGITTKATLGQTRDIFLIRWNKAVTQVISSDETEKTKQAKTYGRH